MDRHQRAQGSNWDWENPKAKGSAVLEGIVSPKPTTEELSPRTKKIIEDAEPLHKKFEEKRKKAAAEREQKKEAKRLRKIERKKQAAAAAAGKNNPAGEDRKKQGAAEKGKGPEVKKLTRAEREMNTFVERERNAAGEGQRKKKAATEAKKKNLKVETDIPHKPIHRIATDSSLASSTDTAPRSRVRNLFRTSRRLFFLLYLCLLIGSNVNFELTILSIILLLLFFAIDVGVYFYTSYTGREAQQWMWLTDLFNAYVIVALYYLLVGRRN